MEIKSIKDIFERLNEYELKNNVFSILLLKKIPIWAYIRSNLAEFMYVKYDIAQSVAPQRNFTIMKIIKTVINGFSSFFLLIRSRKADIWFFETSRRINGKEPYCQPIYEGIDKERYNKFCYSEKWTYNNDVMYLNFIKLVFMAISMSLSPVLFLFMKRHKRKVLNKTIKEILGDNSFSYNQKYIECFLWYVFFTVAVKINKPKKVFIVSNKFFMPLTAVCDKYGIEILEIQHGVISKYSVNYNFKNLDRKWFFPTKILMLGEGWSFMKEYFPKGTQTQVIGSRNVSTNKNILKEDKREGLLFVSQKTIRKHLISFLNANETILAKHKLIFKLHPMEFNLKEAILKEFSESLQEKITIVTDEKGINELQNEVTHQIGAYSTGILEGVQLNLPTLLVDTPLSNHVDFLKKLDIKMTPISDDELKSFLKSGERNYNVEYFSEFKKEVRDEIITV